MRFLGMVCAAVLALSSTATVAYAKDPDSLLSVVKPDAKPAKLTAQEQYFISARHDEELKRAYFTAKVVLTSRKGEVTVLTMDKAQPLGKFLASNSIKAQDYRTDTGESLDLKLVPDHRTALFLFRVNFNSNFTKISIPAPVRTIESSALPLDTEMVLDEGYEGEALQTTVQVSSASSIKKINKKAKRRGISSATKARQVRTITVVRAPSAKVVLVGVGTDTTSIGTPLDLLHPLSGSLSVSSPYGMRNHPILHVYKLHDGVDFSANCGEPVVAATGGVVDFAGTKTGYGNQVEIDHGASFKTSYSHLSEWLVEEGDAVAPGDTIGLVGSTGYSTGCHLHFMTLINDESIDPMGILDR